MAGVGKKPYEGFPTEAWGEKEGEEKVPLLVKREKQAERQGTLKNTVEESQKILGSRGGPTVGEIKNKKATCEQ